MQTFSWIFFCLDLMCFCQWCWYLEKSFNQQLGFSRFWNWRQLLLITDSKVLNPCVIFMQVKKHWVQKQPALILIIVLYSAHVFSFGVFRPHLAVFKNYSTLCKGSEPKSTAYKTNTITYNYGHPTLNYNLSLTKTKKKKKTCMIKQYRYAHYR